MAEAVIIPWIPTIIIGGMILGAFAIASWIYTTHLRVKNGYPLENSWGKPFYPQKNE